MNRRILLVVATICITVATSCDRPPCQNINPVFDQFTPDKEKYKAELAKQIKSLGSENLKYWFQDYIEKDGKTLINVDVQGKGLCAVEEILVENWTNLEGIKRTKGLSYGGAELKGLKVAIAQSPNSTTFLYKDVDHIID